MASILFKQCGSDHMTRGRSRAVDRIVVHYTGTSASARNDVTYFARNEGQGSSAHYFVDDLTEEIYQSVAEGVTAWHAGDWDMNCRSIGIEVVSAGEDYSEAEIGKLAWLVRTLMERYGIGEGGVIRHFDVMGKLRPAPYVDGGRWAVLRARIFGDAGGGGGAGGAAPAGAAGDAAELARRVIAGEFGNGDERRAALGVRYDEVQAEVNRQLLGGGAGGGASGGEACGGVDLDALAWAVIRGDYGNGKERRAALGTDYDAVQRRVNELLS